MSRFDLSEAEWRIIEPLLPGADRRQMLTDACQWFYDCKGCGTVLRLKSGDCCVFCSYRDVPCPPIQEARAEGRSSTRCDPT